MLSCLRAKDYGNDTEAEIVDLMIYHDIFFFRNANLPQIEPGTCMEKKKLLSTLTLK